MFLACVPGILKDCTQRPFMSFIYHLYQIYTSCMYLFYLHCIITLIILFHFWLFSLLKLHIGKHSQWIVAKVRSYESIKL